MIRRLKIWEKLVLICVTFSIPTVVLSYYFVKTSNKDVSFARKERCGNQYNQQVWNLLDKVQQRAQLLARSPSASMGIKDNLAEVDNQLEPLFGNFEALQQKVCLSGTYGSEFAAGQIFTDVKSRWLNIKNNPAADPPEANQKANAELLDELRDLYAQVGDTSNLILDPDLDTYYMIDVTLTKLPSAAEMLNAMILTAWPSVIRKSITPDQKMKLVSEADQLEANLNDTAREVHNAYANNNYYSESRDTLRSAVDADLQNYQALVRRFISTLRDRIIGDNPATMHQTSSVEVSADDFNGVASAALESLNRFFNSATAWEDLGLSARVQYYLSKEYRVLSIVMLVLLLSSVLVVMIARSITRPLNEAVLNLTSASKEILATTTEQASGAREQAAAVAETATTADEITQTAQQAAQRASGMGDAARRTAEVGDAGKKAVDGSIAAMRAVREQIETTAQNILTLAQQAQAIGEIIATVNDIAEETNLLALNAAIEASRAGEHGKGFAVVAGEIKELASQSKQATVQVRQILGEIQKATNAAVLSTENVTRGMGEVTEVSAKAGETIGALAETLTETMRAATQIAASAGQQATGTAQIAVAIKNIDQVTQQTIAATRQSKEAAANLNSIGNQLAALVG